MEVSVPGMPPQRLAVQLPGEQRHTAEVSIVGPSSFDPGEVAMAIITLVAAKGLTLQEVPGAAIAQPDLWQGLDGSALHGPAGRLQLHVHNSDQDATLKRLLH